ncbi:mobilization protein [Rhizobium jaguaris]|uniref:Mobilization protein n=1 Tax=Rhizobium jaguaris TaxID=1312183 RepID=A0A387FW02_9HYPH|nr:mobilization protein [Rhizobium jaguaris]AYG59662.1 mobilization protein [Rhizobium jaguaris]
MARRSIRETPGQREAHKKALQARLNSQERSEDTRREIEVGASIIRRLAHCRDDVSKGLFARLRPEFPGFLTRDRNRTLFANQLDIDTAEGLFDHA